MLMDRSAFRQEFVEEARHRLATLNASLLRLKGAPDSPEIIADIFRETHNLKGSAQMLGFADISRSAHQLEDVFAAAKRDLLNVDTRAFDLVFRTREIISARVEELARASASETELTNPEGGAAAGPNRLTMLPFATVFASFPQAVRELARSFNKVVELTVVGHETELEGRVIESIADPLVHLIRNAVDHGIEAPAERLRLGKPPAGAILISAERHGDRVVVTVRDDGRGIDIAELQATAVRKGIGKAEELRRWTNERLLDLIFESGFSTRVQATDVSGRGVGMDVVRVVVDGLGGAVHVQSDFLQGTTVVMDLPVSPALARRPRLAAV